MESDTRYRVPVLHSRVGLGGEGGRSLSKPWCFLFGSCGIQLIGYCERLEQRLKLGAPDVPEFPLAQTFDSVNRVGGADDRELDVLNRLGVAGELQVDHLGGQVTELLGSPIEIWGLRVSVSDVVRFVELFVSVEDVVSASFHCFLESRGGFVVFEHEHVSGFEIFYRLRGVRGFSSEIKQSPRVVIGGCLLLPDTFGGL